MLFALVIWAGKVFGSRYLHVDNLQSGDLASLARIFTHPGSSVATSLWYVYVLLEFSLVFPLLLALTRGALWPIVALAAALHALPLWFELPDRFGLDLFCEHALWFALGALFIERRSVCERAIAHNALGFQALFALSFLSILLFPDYVSKTIIGLASLPAVYAFAASFRAPRDRRALLLLGEYSFSIYLMNTLAIGFTKGVLLKLAPWDYGNFAFFFPALLAAGVAGPIVVHRWILSQNSWLGRITK